MLNKIKSYLRFWNEKPSYHVEGTVYGGLRMDIDKYYSMEENQEELEEINKTFGKIFKEEQTEQEEPISIA